MYIRFRGNNEMHKIWEQMTDRRARRMVQRTKRMKTLVKSEEQREASYVLNAMHKGKPHDVVDWRSKREATKRKKQRTRAAFAGLREMGMI
jgi:hypothetical protein